MIANSEDKNRISCLGSFLAHTTIQVLLALLLPGCQSGGFSSHFENNDLASLYKDGFPGTASWAVLPFINRTSANKETSAQLERMLMVQLPSAGIVTPKLYHGLGTTTNSNKLDDVQRRQVAKQQATQEDIDFAVAGEITDWHYKEDGQFLLSLKLEVLDIESGQSLWSSNTRGEGLPEQDAFDVSRQLLIDLLASLPINKTH